MKIVGRGVDLVRNAKTLASFSWRNFNEKSGPSWDVAHPNG